MAVGWQVGIDIGGTFTDVVAVGPGGEEIRTAKVNAATEDRVVSLFTRCSVGTCR